MAEMLRASEAAAIRRPRGIDQLGSRITPEHKATQPATQELEFHPLADIFPLIEGVEFDELVADIKANGLHEPIVTYQGMILDGRNRYRACIAAGLDPKIEIMAGDKWIDDPAAYVISANIHRRHLTAEDKRKIIADLLKADPEKSDREIGRMTKADHHKVAKIRKEKESTGEISPVDKRVGADGKTRKQPAKKSTKKAGRKQSVPKPVKHDD
jgi:hypothetical protein